MNTTTLTHPGEEPVVSEPINFQSNNSVAGISPEDLGGDDEGDFVSDFLDNNWMWTLVIILSVISAPFVWIYNLLSKCTSKLRNWVYAAP